MASFPEVVLSVRFRWQQCIKYVLGMIVRIQSSDDDVGKWLLMTAFSSAAPQIWNHIPTVLSESHHHLTPSNVTSKLTTLPHHRLTT